MENYVIIVAGGSGSRMNSTVPKQFIKIGDKPVLMHTIQQFFNFSQFLKIILVLPESQKAGGNLFATNIILIFFIKSLSADKHVLNLFKMVWQPLKILIALWQSMMG